LLTAKFLVNQQSKTGHNNDNKIHTLLLTYNIKLSIRWWK